MIVCLAYFVKTVTVNQEEKVLEHGALEIMFPGSRAKIVDFLLIHQEYDYSVSDIARFSGLSFKTALNEIHVLRKMGILTAPRNVGNAKLYRISKTSPIAQKLNMLVADIVMQGIDS